MSFTLYVVTSLLYICYFTLCCHPLYSLDILCCILLFYPFWMAINFFSPVHFSSARAMDSVRGWDAVSPGRVSPHNPPTSYTGTYHPCSHHCHLARSFRPFDPTTTYQFKLIILLYPKPSPHTLLYPALTDK